MNASDVREACGAAALMRDEPQDLGGLKVMAPTPVRNGTFRRLAGQVRWSGLITPWPRTEWDVSPSGPMPTRQGDVSTGTH